LVSGSLPGIGSIEINQRVDHGFGQQRHGQRKGVVEGSLVKTYGSAAG
jgi:hypothetical protein